LLSTPHASAMRRRPNLLVDEPPLQVLPTLAASLGLAEAIVLQQLHYWLQKPGVHRREGRPWVYNSYEEWRQQFPFWSVTTIKRIFSHLERQGIVMSQQYEKKAWERRKWYSLNYQRLSQLVGPPTSDRRDASTRRAQIEPFEGVTMSRSTRSLLSAFEDTETSSETSTILSSSTAADGTAAEGTGDGSNPANPTLKAQPGELHLDVIALVHSMVTTAFHCLAEATKVNEDFWDAQIDLIHTQTGLSLEVIIRDIDTYYALHPRKCPSTPEAAMACMAYDIKFALDKAKRQTRG
jgi:hypothetical protein